MNILDNGSTFMVPATKILNVRSHGNADSLEIATVLGFDVIIRKDSFKVNDLVLYVPVDAILNPDIELKLLGNAKIKLNGGRVRACKIRGFVSQGMIASPELLGVLKPKEGKDYKELLQIQKYAPPERNINGMKSKVNKVKLKDHPLFHSYNGLDNFKWYPDLFKEGELVVVQEKLHGTNARYSILPYTTDTLWRKFVKWLGLAPKYEKNYGSNNVQISRKFGYKGFYGEDVYGNVGKKLKIFDKIKPNEIVYGEIIGPGIQKGYNYGHTEHHFVLFDVKVYDEETRSMKWLDPKQVNYYAKERGFEMVPELFYGDFRKEDVMKLTKGPSVYCPEEKVREGIVIKSIFEYNDPMVKSDRKSLKVINEDYLLDASNTDLH